MTYLKDSEKSLAGGSFLVCLLDGTYHFVSSKHLQSYIDEFAYYYNQRFAGISVFHDLLYRLCRQYSSGGQKIPSFGGGKGFFIIYFFNVFKISVHFLTRPSTALTISFLSFGVEYLSISLTLSDVQPMLNITIELND